MAFEAGSVSANLTLDRSQFTTELDLAKEAGNAFNGQTFSAKLAADAIQFNSTATAVRTEAAGIGGLRPTVTIGAQNNTGSTFSAVRTASTQIGALRPTVIVGATNNTGGVFAAVRAGAAQIGALRPTVVAQARNAAQATFNAVRAGAAQIGALRPTVVAQARNATQAVFNAVRAGAAQIGALRPSVTVGARNATQAVFNAVRAGAAQIGAMRPTVTVSGDAGPWARVAGAAGQVALGLGRLRPTITVTGNSATWDRTAASATASANAIGRLRPTITVAANTTQLPTATAAAAAFSAAVGRLRPTITVNVNTSQLAIAGAQVQSFGTLMSSIASSVAGAFSAVPWTVAFWGALAAAIALATAAIGPIASAATVAGSAAGVLAGGFGLVAGAAYTLSHSSSPQVIAAFNNLKGAFENLKTNMMNAFEPAALKLADLGQKAIDIAQNQVPALGSAANTTMAEVTRSVNQAIERLGPSASDSFQTILQAIPGFMGDITSAATTFGAGFASIMAQATPLVSQFGQWIQDTAQAFFQWTQSEEGRQQIQRFLDAAVPVAQALWQAFSDIVPKLIDIGITYGPTVVTAINDLKGAFDLVIEAINGILAVADPILNFFQGIIDGITGADDTVTQKTQDMQGTFSGFVYEVGNLLGGLVSIITWPFQQAYDLLIGSSIVPEMVDGIEEWIRSIPDKITTALSNLVSSVTQPFTDAWNWISSEVGDWANRAYNLAVNMIQSMINGLSNSANALYTTISNIGSNAIGWLKSSLGISSPSRPATEFGQNVGVSLSISLLSMVGLVRSSARTLGLAAIPDAIPGSIALPRVDTSALGDTVTPMVSPGMPSMSGVSSIFGTREAGGGVGGLEDRITRVELSVERLNATLVGVLTGGRVELSPATAQRIGAGAADGMNYSLEHSPATRQAVLNGQNRELERRLFVEGKR